MQTLHSFGAMCGALEKILLRWSFRLYSCQLFFYPIDPVSLVVPVPLFVVLTAWTRVTIMCQLDRVDMSIACQMARPWSLNLIQGVCA